jgi:hypothetical protein
MTRSFARLFFLSLALFALASCTPASAREGDPYAALSSSASATALPSEDVSPPVPSGRPPWQPDFTRAAPVPADPTPAPAKEEWASAAEAADVRVSDPGCTAKRLREWVRVECKEVVGFERVTGPLEDASFGCFNETPVSSDFHYCERAWVVFALRRGQRRAFQSFRPTKWSSTPDTFVSGQFLAKDPTPVVTVQGIRGGV